MTKFEMVGYAYDDVKKKYLCKKCLEEISYNEELDAEFCRNCNEWLIPTCSDNECEFCTRRPNKPMSEEEQ